VRKLDAAAERPADYFEEQPFGQVPSHRDDTVSLFESGAIVLHVGRNREALVPADPAAQARATAWLIAALNSVEPFVKQLATIDIFCVGEEMGETTPAGGGRDDRQAPVAAVRRPRRQALSRRRCVTAGDLMMTSVLRSLDGKNLLERHPNLVAYKARCQARPAFAAAIAAQLADFEQREAISA
jgi:Glutathione S-transferase